MEKKYYLFFNEGSKINQIICALLITMAVLAYGTAIGWMSPMTLLLQSANSPRGEPLSDGEISWMAAVPYLTCVPADFIFGYTCDRWGRKINILVTSGHLLACWTIKLISTATWAFILARALLGVTMAGCFVVTCLYIKEISEISIRGALGTLVILSQTVGNLLLYVIGDVMSYRAVLWFCFTLPFAHILLFLMMPESPSYLIRQGKKEEARKILCWLRCRNETDPVIQREMELLKKEQEEEMENSKFALKTILSTPILCKAFRIAMVLCLAREVCGAIPVLNFAGDIFRMAAEDGAGLVLTPNQQAMMLGVVQVVGAAVASSLVEKTGRKPLLLITSLASGLSMCVLASWFLAQSLQVAAPAWIPLVSLCLCIFCDSAGLQPLSFVVMSELFSFQFRSTVTAITMASGAFSDVIQMLFFKPIATTVGVHVTFYIFGVICLFNAAYVVLTVPETKMRSLDEIYEELRSVKEGDEKEDRSQGFG